MAKWHLVKTNPPEYLQEVLVRFKNGTVTVGYRSKIYESWQARIDSKNVYDMEDIPVWWIELQKILDK